MVLELTLTEVPLAVARLEASADVPVWAGRDGGGFLSVTRTADELSVVCAEALVPADVPAERDWRAFTVRGPLDFGLTGVLVAIATPLADAGIPVFVVSTHDTDHVLVRGGDAAAAAARLRAAGHRVG